MKIPTYGYKAGAEPKIFDLEPGQSLPDGWSDSPVSAKSEQASPEAPAQDHDEVDALRAEATGLGVEVDQRWGARRLKREIENARNDNA